MKIKHLSLQSLARLATGRIEVEEVQQVVIPHLIGVCTAFLAALLTLNTLAARSSAAWEVGRVHGAVRTGTFEIAHREALAANPPDLSLALSVFGGRATFHQGELIPLNLSFATRSLHRYFIDTAEHDHSGRIDYEDFHLDPAQGGSDPLWQYFADTRVYLGGGMRGMGEIGVQPTRISLALNEWVRFDRPGHYRLFVVSHRVQHLSTRRPDSGEGPPICLASNVIEITVISDPRWSAEAMAAAVRTLNSDPNAVKLAIYDPAAFQAISDPHRTACQTLRFLGTEGAVRELAGRLGSDDQECESEYILGLYGLRDWRPAVAAMEKRLDAAHAPVTGKFLHVLSTLAIGQVPRSPDLTGIFGARRLARLRETTWRAREAKRHEALARYSHRLLKVLPRKQGRAKAVGALALLDLTRHDCGDHPEQPIVDSRLADLLRAQVAAAFNDLTAREQELLLGWQWGQVKSPAMVTALVRLYDAPPAPSHFGGESLPTLAARRLFELAPEKAIELVGAEAGRATPRVGPLALGLLPPAVVAPLESRIVDHLLAVPPSQAGMDELSFLVARYADVAVLPQIRAYYDQHLNRGMCLGAPFLAYFLRVDPGLGEEKLIEALDGPATKGRPDCASGVLGNVSKYIYTPTVEAIAIAHLDATDPEVAVDAANVLGRFSSGSAEESLWRRLERWHDRWSGHQFELAGNVSEARLGDALVKALVTAPGWLADRAKLDRLQSLLQGLDETGNLQNLVALREDRGRIRLNGMLDTEGHPELTVGQYTTLSVAAAKAKIAQFPRGTQFVWSPDCLFTGTSHEKALFDDLRQYLEALGMALGRE